MENQTARFGNISPIHGNTQLGTVYLATFNGFFFKCVAGLQLGIYTVTDASSNDIIKS